MLILAGLHFADQGAARSDLTLKDVRQSRLVVQHKRADKCLRAYRLDRRARELLERRWARVVERWEWRLVKTRRAAERCSPVGLGRHLAARRGWTGYQWAALYALWNHESGWNPRQWNHAGSGACGIPQALPCSKMCGGLSLEACPTRRQIRGGLGYVRGRYGSPAVARAHSLANGWY